MDPIMLEVVKYVGVGLIGMFVHFIFSVGKINKLTTKIDELIDTVRSLTIRIESVDALRSELFQLEKRVSDNEARIKFNSQD